MSLCHRAIDSLHALLKARNKRTKRVAPLPIITNSDCPRMLQKRNSFIFQKIVPASASASTTPCLSGRKSTEHHHPLKLSSNGGMNSPFDANRRSSVGLSLNTAGSRYVTQTENIKVLSDLLINFNKDMGLRKSDGAHIANGRLAAVDELHRTRDHCGRDDGTLSSAGKGQGGSSGRT